MNHKYLNIDMKRFYETSQELLESIGCSGIIKTITMPFYRQVLYAAGQKDFSEDEAIFISRDLSGLLIRSDIREEVSVN